MAAHSSARPEASLIRISTPHEFRTALQRIRNLEPAPATSAAGLERAALEIAISRYLALQERTATSDAA
jgi:hypothetical protein